MRNFKTCLLTINFAAIWLAASLAHSATPGITFTTLAAFDGTNNGAEPYDPPVLGADGNLYGTLPYGGTNNAGAIFQVTTNGTQTTFYNFNNWDGNFPAAPLVSGRDGNLYGVAAGGGTNNQGTIFEITTNGTFTLLYSFGMMTNDLGYALDGSTPYGGLVQGRDGNFYGVTYSGGISNEGTVFQFLTNGTLTTLHSFTGKGGSDDGAYPYTAPLVEGADGVFYGTTYEGGTNGDGTIFQITADGTLTTLFEFNGTDGLYPYAGLSLGEDGNLYGTTIEGGTNSYGTAFQITTNGVLTTLFQFGGADGLYYPEGGLVPGFNGLLYGTIYQAATTYGAVFQLTTNGVMTTLYSFTNGTDGANPYAGVIRDAAGNLYGTALYGGNQGGYGTVYRLSFSTILSITSPTANELWSNGVFNVTGMASDNVADNIVVTNVLYSLNGSDWTSATTANGWINWTTSVTLAPGTNTLRAYAVDSVGNVSPTNTVMFGYIQVATLTVLTNGEGTISPDYNGALLTVGASYSMTAKAAKGFDFVNWTDGTGDVLTSSTALNFIMASNLTLTANFMDLTKPTLSVTAPNKNQTWNSDMFTVTGTTKDNWQLAGVFYSLNGAGWTEATTANNWTNWTAQVTLTPGPNTIQAYAMDAAGGFSATDTVTFTYVLSAPLTVGVNGSGTIKPDYNGELLQIGASYSMTAKAAKGFAFTGWTGSATTSSATLQFIMASNLTFTANFADAAKPTLKVTAPKAKQKLDDGVFTVTGTAVDNVGVANVFYSLNGAGWGIATTANNWASWTAQVTLTPGANTLQAYAVDAAGNVSATETVTFTYVLSAPLTVGLNGNGTIKPDYNGELLEVGASYSMTAKAAKGFAFTGWTGSVTTNSVTLKFIMASNLTFTANFADVTKPTLSVTAPKANQKWSNDVFTVTGTASDNVGVAGVFYSLNGSDWTGVSTANGWADWTASVSLAPGTNTLQAYAVDAAGNVSTTDTVKFAYVTVDWAPSSLNGLVAAITPEGQSTFYDGFWPDTFSQSSPYTNNYNGVGSYTYAKLGTNTARLTITYTLPPVSAGANSSASVFLTFASGNTCIFSNEVDSTDLGEITFSAAADLIPASWNGKKTALVDNAGQLTSVSFSTKMLTVTNSDGTVEKDNYVFKQYSPVGGLLIVTQSGTTNYVELTFSTTDHGNYFDAQYDSSGWLGGDSGVFALMSQARGGNAPASLAGTTALVTQDGSSFLLSLSATTFTQTSEDTNNNNGAGTYTYTSLGNNTAQLTISYATPPTVTNESGSVFLTFVAPDFCLFTNMDDNGSNYLATFSFSAAANLVPDSLTGHTLTATNQNGAVDVVTFNGDGTTFSQLETGSDNPGISTGTYAFTTYSLIGGMLQLNFTGGVLAGSTSYVQVTFTDGNDGTFFTTFYDGLADPSSTSSGTFTFY